MNIEKMSEAMRRLIRATSSFRLDLISICALCEDGRLTKQEMEELEPILENITESFKSFDSQLLQYTDLP